MSSSANLSVLPPDIKQALQSATNLIDGLRLSCKVLRRVAWLLNGMTCGKTFPPGLRKFSRKGELVDEVEFLSPQLRKANDDLAKLTGFCNCCARPLHDELAKVGCELLGPWAVPSVTYGVGGIAFFFRQSVEKLYTKRTTPYSESEFIAIAAEHEPYLDELRAEVMRETKSVALARVCAVMVADPAQPNLEESREFYVTIDQAAALVNRHKRTLERLKSRMPPPRVKGGRGRPAEWAWAELRPWLAQEFGKPLPTVPPHATGRQ